MTGVQNGPISDSFSSKKSLINSSTPVVGSVAMIDTGSEFGHAAVVTKVNSNGTVNVIEANYYSPGAIGTRTNVPTV
ncbi:CHAP domain-containing protein [Candidatus Peribacteria bacterium]|nr:CHAP domain-containing protein [Candidatus Peribacteria bacterium]